MKCAFCLKDYEPISGSTFCSKGCGQKDWRKRNGKVFEPFTKNCEHCDKEFVAERKNAKFCSRECTKTGNNRRIVLVKNEKIREQYSDLPECKICKYQARALHSHVLNHHNLTVDQYKIQFQCTDNDLYHESYTNQLSERVQGENNPAFDHGGKFSPFSKKFVNYNGFTNDEIETSIQELIDTANQTKSNNNSHTTRLDYYTSRGYTEEQAKELLSERQTTFSLEKCIEKHGKNGFNVWQQRQFKWLNNFPKQNYSKISQEMFRLITEKLNDPENVRFATNDPDIKNNEKILKLGCGVVKLDFFYHDKIIEFDGDYWHGEERGNKIRDEIREEAIKIAFPEFKILHILERDYKKNPELTVQQCLEFLNS